LSYLSIHNIHVRKKKTQQLIRSK